jgi:hypothetical protein
MRLMGTPATGCSQTLRASTGEVLMRGSKHAVIVVTITGLVVLAVYV